jgi:hypothetical protein
MAERSRPPPRVHHVQTCARSGVRVAVHEWPPSSSPVVHEWPPSSSPVVTTVVLLHATGFHARCWDTLVAALPPHWRCLCVDQVRSLRRGIQTLTGRGSGSSFQQRGFSRRASLPHRRARGCPRPPCRHFETQSCRGLGSARQLLAHTAVPRPTQQGVFARPLSRPPVGGGDLAAKHYARRFGSGLGSVG